ncbi:MAG: hypothetical protein GEU80_04795 [Dehalococcoidia bacterium]|nr:hypothetical protein [Dehalococcoidia bacterium]
MSQRRILQGVRVVDFTRVVAGPYCTRMLADMGADVVKVDAPGPPAGGPARSAGSIANNLGKRSVVLDLKSAAGIEAAWALIERADVLVENFRPGVMAGLGLGFDACAERSPRLVYSSISGFGQAGTFSHRRAYGATAHAEAGWLWVQQQAVGTEAPFAPGVTVADLMTGLTAFSGIVAALYDREHTGRGQHVDTSLMDCQLQMLSEVAGAALNGAAPEAWQPFRHPVHGTRDGHYVTINIGGPHNWDRIAGAFGHPGEAMPVPPPAANERVGEWAAALDAAPLAEAMERTGAPYGVMMSMHEAAAHPYFAERGMVAEVEDPVEGRFRAVDSALFFSDAASGALAPAPFAGEHTREVLTEAGLTEEQVDALLATGSAEQVEMR